MNLSHPAVAAISAALLLSNLFAVRVASAQSDLDQVVATQGSSSLTLAEIDAYAEGIPPDQRAKVFNSASRVDSILRSLLASQKLVSEAEQLALDEDPRIRARMRHAAEAVLIKERLNALRDKIAAATPDFTELAHERYLADPTAYFVEQSVDVRHILIGTEGRTDEAALRMTEKLIAQLRKDPDSFVKLVKKYSDDESKSRNLGYIQNAASDQYVKEFREAAQGISQENEIVGPIKTRYGYHIIKLLSRTPAHQLSFEDVQAKLEKELREEYIDAQLRHHVDEIRSTPIEVQDPELAKSLLTRYSLNGDAQPKNEVRVEHRPDSLVAPRKSPVGDERTR